MPVYNSYESVISAKSPSIWIRSNETAGTPSNSGSLACSLTAYGAPQLNYDSSVDGRSIYLNGSSGYQLSNFPSFSLLDDRSFTVETWFKSPTTGYTSDFSGHFFRIDTPNAGVPGGGMGFRIFGTGVGNAAFYGRLELYVDAGASPFYNIVSPAGVSYNDNMWHHAVATINTTSIKMYVDGSLVAQQTIATSAIDWDDLTGTKTIGYSTTTSEFFKGQIDEFAIYDRELSPSDINANYVAGAAVYFNDIPGTASALMVQPVLTTQTLYAASPMTASALAGDTRVSNFNYSNLLEPYMATLTLEQWSKFDTGTTVLNYGSGGYGQWAAQGNIKVGNFGLGLQGSGCLVNTTTGSSGRLESLTVEGTGGAVYSNVVNPELRDQSFVIGFWFKATNNPAAEILLAESDDDSGSERFRIKLLTSGYVSLESQDPNETKTITNSTDLADGNWHFVTAKYDDGDIQLWIDATSVGTDSHASVHTQDYRNFYLLKNTETFSANNEILMSQFFIGTVANIGTTQISGIYTAGSNGVIQASATMPMPVAEFKNKYNDFVISKGAIIDLRMDEASGSPINFGTTSSTFTKTGTNVTYSNATNNRFAYRLTSKDTTFEGPWSTTAGTFTTNNQQTLAVRVKIDGSATAANFIVGTAAYTNGAGIILQQMPTSNKYRLRVIRENPVSTYTFDDLQSVSSYNDNKYHHVVLTKNGTSLKIYVDGKLENSMNTAAVNLTDSGTFTIGGETTYGIPTTAAKNVYVDEVALFNYEMSAQEIFEFYQALSLEDGPGSASGELVMPTNIAGTGVSPAISPMLANTGTLPMPALSLGIGILHDHFEAFGAFVLPNYGANVNIDANYGASPLTADADLHMPGFSVGEINAVVHMEASALMGNVTVILPGQVQASPGVANNATLVMPGIVTIKGARIFAETLNAYASLPIPPAYIQLTDDKWFNRLLNAHADRKTEPVQSFLSSLPNQTTSDVIQGGFLSFFDNVYLDITPTTATNTFSSEIPEYFFSKADSYNYDNNGNILAPDTTKNLTRAIATRNSSTPQSILSVGTYDNYERKSVRISNIEFPLPNTSVNHSTRAYNLEFSFKTTKANQIIAYGNWASFYYYQSSMGTVGLFDGKISLMSSYQNIGKAKVIPHPSNIDALSKAGLNTGYTLGNKKVNDGQWHHVVIQYGFTDNRTQIWIDGKLDKQVGVVGELGGEGYSTEPGTNGYNNIRPYILGFNSDDTNLNSDFETSAWNFYPGRFISSTDIGLNYLAYQKSEPIYAAPMLADITMPQDSRGDGNKSRALLLYWWPRDYEFPAVNQIDKTFYDLYTRDEPGNPPQDFNGWDIFPIDILGRRQSDIINKETWVSGGYRDKLTSAPRYLDIVNDLDLDKFDAIFFLNYPETSAELDEYVREEFSDEYFQIKEKDLYADFLKSLRAAVDTGMSLYITNKQLALDMGIIDRVETIPVFNELVNNDNDFSDFRGPVITGQSKLIVNNQYVYNGPDNSKLPIALNSAAQFYDVSNNMKHRIINEVEYLTDDSSYAFTDRAYYNPDDKFDYGAPNRSWYRYEYKQNGLETNDEICFGDMIPTSFGMVRPRQTSLDAVPFENVKAGKIVAAQPAQYYNKNTLTANPYANYAHIIALEENDVLNGRPVGGKILVNFTEKFWDLHPEYNIVDLVSDFWINKAFELSLISEQDRTELKQRPAYTGNLAVGSPERQVAEYWSSNGMFAFMQMNGGDSFAGVLGLLFDNDIEYRKVPSTRKGLPSAARARDALGRFASGSGSSSGPQRYTLVYGRSESTMNVYVPTMITRGFWWLSTRTRLTGLVYRSEAMTATVTLKQGTAVVDKNASINSEPMVSNAIITNIASSTLRVINFIATPLTASAIMTVEGKNITASPFIASSLLPNANAVTFGLEPIILKLEHTDPVLYIRGDKIK
jgi:hypothetical protein